MHLRTLRRTRGSPAREWRVLARTLASDSVRIPRVQSGCEATSLVRCLIGSVRELDRKLCSRAPGGKRAPSNARRLAEGIALRWERNAELLPYKASSISWILLFNGHSYGET